MCVCVWSISDATDGLLIRAEAIRRLPPAQTALCSYKARQLTSAFLDSEATERLFQLNGAQEQLGLSFFLFPV